MDAKGPQSYFPSIEKKYGHPIQHWLELVQSHRDGRKHGELVTWLKQEHGLGHGHATAVVGHVLAQPSTAAPAPSSSTTFRAELELNGKTATGFTVPAEVVEALGAGKRPRVDVTVNGSTFTLTLGVMDGKTKIPVSAERRAAAGLRAGETYEVTLGLA